MTDYPTRDEIDAAEYPTLYIPTKPDCDGGPPMSKKESQTHHREAELWIDLETTGLGVHSELLEVFALWRDAHTHVQLGEFYAIAPTVPAGIKPEVVDMHTDNGLLAEISAIAGLDTGATQYKTQHGEWQNATMLNLWLTNRRIMHQHGIHTATLCGSGIAHFDRPWLEKQAYGYRLVQDCTYYMKDVGVLRRVMETIPGYRPPVRATPKAHRARLDVMEHMGEYDWLTEQIRTAFWAANRNGSERLEEPLAR